MAVGESLEAIGTTVVAAVVDSLDVVRHPVHRLKALFGLEAEPTVGEKIEKALADARNKPANPDAQPQPQP
jgi:hypothetical protein